jgi:hypothetical protein
MVFKNTSLYFRQLLKLSGENTKFLFPLTHYVPVITRNYSLK